MLTLLGALLAFVLDGDVASVVHDLGRASVAFTVLAGHTEMLYGG